MTLRAQLAEQSSDAARQSSPHQGAESADRRPRASRSGKRRKLLARSLENDAKLADAKVAAQLVAFDQLKSQAVTSNEDDVRLRALERDAKSQRDLLEIVSWPNTARRPRMTASRPRPPTRG